jgi:hypothetical protein
MSVNDLGQIDLYQWLYFLAQHGRRHVQQLHEVAGQAGLGEGERASRRSCAVTCTRRLAKPT